MPSIIKPLLPALILGVMSGAAWADTYAPDLANSEWSQAAVTRAALERYYGQLMDYQQRSARFNYI